MSKHLNDLVALLCIVLLNVAALPVMLAVVAAWELFA